MQTETLALFEADNLQRLNVDLLDTNEVCRTALNSPHCLVQPLA
jgi:hypothetical protein